MIARRASRSLAAAYFTTKRGVTSRWKPASARRSRSTFASSFRAASWDGSRSSTARRWVIALAGSSRWSCRWASSRRTSGSGSARTARSSGPSAS